VGGWGGRGRSGCVHSQEEGRKEASKKGGFISSMVVVVHAYTHTHKGPKTKLKLRKGQGWLRSCRSHPWPVYVKCVEKEWMGLGCLYITTDVHGAGRGVGGRCVVYKVATL
jgi:hypothetical protein